LVCSRESSGLLFGLFFRRLYGGLLLGGGLCLACFLAASASACFLAASTSACFVAASASAFFFAASASLCFLRLDSSGSGS
jgi:hypothetical protein